MEVELLVVGAIVYSQRLVLFQDARLAEIGCHDGVAKEVGTSTDVKVAPRRVGIVLGDGVYPVNVGIEVGVIVAARAVNLRLSEGLHLPVLVSKLIEQGHIVGSIEEFRQHRRLVD